jgi:hypothetical protein
MVSSSSFPLKRGQPHKRKGVDVAICPMLDRLFDSSYLIHQAADAPAWCGVSRGNELLTIGVCFPSTSSGTTRHDASVPAQALLLFKSYIILARFGSAPDLERIPLAAVEFIESGTLICERWFSIVTSDSTYRFQYRICDEACVQLFLYHLRNRLMSARAGAGLAQGISCGATLELKFACAEADELDPEESVLIRFFSPHIRTVERHHWFWQRDLWLPADYLSLTTRRLLWLSDRHNGKTATGGIVARYCPLGSSTRIKMEREMGGWEVRVCFASASTWRIPVADGSMKSVCCFMEVFRARERVCRHRADEYQTDTPRRQA